MMAEIKRKFGTRAPDSNTKQHTTTIHHSTLIDPAALSFFDVPAPYVNLRQTSRH
jgi:hypothetical protein